MGDILQLEMTTAGSGPPLFLIHAFPMDHTMWDAQMPSLVPRRRVSRVDLPGFGVSARSPGWTLAEVARSILRLADEQGIAQFGIGGLSMGAYTAFEVVRQAPERVDCLVLANGRARADNPSERTARTTTIDSIRSNGIQVLEDRMLPRLIRPQSTEAFVAQVRSALRRARADAVCDALGALRDRADSTAVLAGIGCPTLVIAGDGDPITPVSDCQAMAGAIPGARFEIIPEAGHLTNLENPKPFDRALVSFLESC